MLIRSKRLIITLVAALTAANVAAQEPEVVVGEIAFPQHVWGMQTLPFEVTNNTDWLKFLVVETDGAFEGSYVNPHRVVHTTFILEPLARTTVESKLEIPPNYGQLKLWLRIYDVVDTLDDPGLGTLVFEQPFSIKFHLPETVMPYFQDRISLPPMAGNHGLLDNEFARLMLLLLQENKTVPEIASICQTDTSFVKIVAEQMVSEKYLKKDQDKYSVNVPIINKAYAESGRKLADRISDRLAETIAANLTHRRSVIDSLVKAGVYSGDSTRFVEGGTLLYRPYPLIGGLYLWQVLGQMFIIGSRPLNIFEDTDPCNARIGPYLYLVQGGDYFNGHHFFEAQPNGGYESRFGDSVPVVTCLPGFEKAYVARESVDWNYPSAYSPDMYLYDSTFINPMLRTIDVGVEPIMLDAMTELRKINSQFYTTDLMMATRYWFWNLTASLTLEKLVAGKAVTRTGNGQYKYMEKKD
ncbi:MAG: hypothetical protein NTW07_10845 [candidate division Zixibacteria bacterium]|nr:hypothetical protein [candidate division Zixibacteria bacterium]